MIGHDVILVSLPLSAPRYPSLALSLLKPAIERIGLRCDVRYFSLDYVDEIGKDAFECLTDMRYYTALVGEWVFAAAAHQERIDPATAEFDVMRYLAEVFQPKCPERELVSRLVTILTARHGATAFIERCFGKVDWQRYGVLGVSTSFQQNMASLAFAQRVKERCPNILVVFGGANCQGEMGVELHRRYPFIDAVCLGEGDRTFPDLVQRHLAGTIATDLPGFVFRDEDGTSRLPALAVDQVENLDELPYPDVSDFFNQRRTLPVSLGYAPALLFETARGCWWGAKHHCTFCGLNGRTMSYRSKSQTRAYEELKYLVAQFDGDVVLADAILNLRYFDDFLPRLAAQGPLVRMFWQMKANLRPEQLMLLARAGVKRIQPGIEALDSELLALMKKGCTMLQNVQLLKLAAESGLSVAWNLLYGFPGEHPDSYTRAADLMPKLHHLQPPATTGRVLADRFSPYFQCPEAYGVSLEPAIAYRFIHPFEESSVQRLAYHFHMHSSALDRIGQITASLKAAQRQWCEHAKESALYSDDRGGVITVTDARWGWPRSTRTFAGAQAEVLRLCWRNTSWNSIKRHLGSRYHDAEIRSAITPLIDFGFLIQEDSEFLALPLRQPGWRRAPTWREVIRSDVTPYLLARTSEANNELHCA